MTILCLHGAFGSASVSKHSQTYLLSQPLIISEKNFKVQLGRFIEEIEKSGSVNFKWIDGAHDAQPPPGFDSYFGSPPLYRFIDFDGTTELDDMMSKIRDLPEGLTAEDTMRRLVGGKEMFKGPAVKSTLERIFEILDDDPEIDVGYRWIP